MKGMITLRARLAQAGIGLFTTLFALFCLFPLVIVVSTSLSSESEIASRGFTIIPRGFTLDAYELLYRDNDLLANSYLVTVLVTGIGTILAVLITGMAAFAINNKHVRYRNAFALFFFVPMVFHSGIVPWYLMSRAIGLYDNLLALIIPKLVFNPFNLFLVRNYMAGLPDSLTESAKMDGANDLTIAFRIYFPLSVPILATIALFYGLNYWNDWWNAIMLVNRETLYPLQFMLFKIQSELRMLEMLQNMGVEVATDVQLPSESLKMATAVVTIGPIVLLYPFLQRYFVKGLVIGSVKG